MASSRLAGGHPLDADPAAAGRRERLDPRPFATHYFNAGDIIDAYGVFALAAKTNALKMVLTRS